MCHVILRQTAHSQQMCMHALNLVDRQAGQLVGWLRESNFCNRRNVAQLRNSTHGAGMGGGSQRNRHLYDVHCVVSTDMTFLTKDHISELDEGFPEFKLQVQRLAAKRAQRFGT